ncbi:hypothetical protein DD592_27365, partial [Enterobacter cloacae complex sp. 2DZ2F20B]
QMGKKNRVSRFFVLLYAIFNIQPQLAPEIAISIKVAPERLLLLTAKQNEPPRLLLLKMKQNENLEIHYFVVSYL